MKDMVLRNNNLIVSYGCINPQYEALLRRQRLSLQRIGWDMKDYWWRFDKNYPDHLEKPYIFKTNILYGLYNDTNYKNILWVDSSFTFNKSPQALFDRIDRDGYYVSVNGFNCAQSVNDRCLMLMNFSRSQAELIPEVASGCVGFNLESENGINLLKLWKEEMERGCSIGSRTYNPVESSDKRFLFHRQDQSVLSLCMKRLSLTPGGFNEFWSYEGNEKIMTCRGGKAE